MFSLLSGLQFKNLGMVENTDQFVWNHQVNLYTESQNVTQPWFTWLDAYSFNYLYKVSLGIDLQYG